ALVRAAALIDRMIEKETFTRNHESYTLRRWLEQLPEQLIEAHPDLCFAYARILLYTRAPHTLPDPAQIEDLLRIAENAWRAQHNPVRLGESLAFRSVFALLRGDHTHITTSAQQALRSLPQEDIVWRSISLNLIATEAVRDGQFPPSPQT